MGKAFCVIAFLSIVAGVPAQHVQWDFESDTSDWRPRADTVEVQHTPSLGATEGSQACLRIAGALTHGWNYALSNRIPVQEKTWYRLSAWVRVDGVGPRTPMPYLKCEFVGRESGQVLGMAVTDPYQNRRMGRWQELACRFAAPNGVKEGIVAFEKGTSDPTEIDAYLDEVRVEPISEAQVYLEYMPADVSDSLEAIRGLHPRLYLTEQRIEELRAAVATSHAALWSEVVEIAETLAATAPPTYEVVDDDRGELWQRPVGNAMPYLALAYRLTEDPCYLEAAERWALASCDYPSWGAGELDGMDLAAGHQLYGLALVYDWCYSDLDAYARERIRTTLIARGSALFRAVATERVWWHRLYLQNRMAVNSCGLAAAGLALFDEFDEAYLWTGLAMDNLRRTLDALGTDGAGHEGRNSGSDA
jgi:hypothetical protein